MSDEEEVAILVAEVDRLKREAEERKPNLIVRVWLWLTGLFGVLVYGGPKTCGHCVYWSRPLPRLVRYSCNDRFHDGYRCNRMYHWKIIPRRKVGTCKLTYGKWNRKPDETCGRFKPRRRYKHRVRLGGGCPNEESRSDRKSLQDAG